MFQALLLNAFVVVFSVHAFAAVKRSVGLFENKLKSNTPCPPWGDWKEPGKCIMPSELHEHISNECFGPGDVFDVEQQQQQQQQPQQQQQQKRIQKRVLRSVDEANELPIDSEEMFRSMAKSKGSYQLQKTGLARKWSKPRNRGKAIKSKAECSLPEDVSQSPSAFNPWKVITNQCGNCLVEIRCRSRQSEYACSPNLEVERTQCAKVDASTACNLPRETCTLLERYANFYENLAEKQLKIVKSANQASKWSKVPEGSFNVSFKSAAGQPVAASKILQQLKRHRTKSLNTPPQFNCVRGTSGCSCCCEPYIPYDGRCVDPATICDIISGLPISQELKPTQTAASQSAQISQSQQQLGSAFTQQTEQKPQPQQPNVSQNGQTSSQTSQQTTEHQQVLEQLGKPVPRPQGQQTPSQQSQANSIINQSSQSQTQQSQQPDNQQQKPNVSQTSQTISQSEQHASQQQQQQGKPIPKPHNQQGTPTHGQTSSIVSQSSQQSQQSQQQGQQQTPQIPVIPQAQKQTSQQTQQSAKQQQSLSQVLLQRPGQPALKPPHRLPHRKPIAKPETFQQKPQTSQSQQAQTSKFSHSTLTVEQQAQQQQGQQMPSQYIVSQQQQQLAKGKQTSVQQPRPQVPFAKPQEQQSAQSDVSQNQQVDQQQKPGFPQQQQQKPGRFQSSHSSTHQTHKTQTSHQALAAPKPQQQKPVSFANGQQQQLGQISQQGQAKPKPNNSGRITITQTHTSHHTVQTQVHQKPVKPQGRPALGETEQNVSQAEEQKLAQTQTAEQSGKESQLVSQVLKPAGQTEQGQTQSSEKVPSNPIVQQNQETTQQDQQQSQQQTTEKQQVKPSQEKPQAEQNKPQSQQGLTVGEQQQMFQQTTTGQQSQQHQASQVISQQSNQTSTQQTQQQQLKPQGQSQLPQGQTVHTTQQTKPESQEKPQRELGQNLAQDKTTQLSQSVIQQNLPGFQQSVAGGSIGQSPKPQGQHTQIGQQQANKTHISIEQMLTQQLGQMSQQQKPKPIGTTKPIAGLPVDEKIDDPNSILFGESTTTKTPSTSKPIAKIPTLGQIQDDDAGRPLHPFVCTKCLLKPGNVSGANDGKWQSLQ